MMTKSIDTQDGALRYWFIAAAGLILAIGTAFRFYGLNRGLEYDEIWTLNQYGQSSFSQIFSALETPNNHPLNSLLIKYCIMIFGFSETIIRLPVLVCGLATILLSGILIYRLLRSPEAALTGMLLVSFNPMLIAYSQTARGYAIQTCMLLLLVVLVVVYEQTMTVGAIKKYLLPAGIFLAGLATVTSVTSGIIFVAVLLFLHGFYVLNGRSSGWNFHPWRNLSATLRPDLMLWLAYLLILGIGSKWLTDNYEQLQAARSFGGIPVRSPLQFGEFLSLTFMSLLGGWLLLFAAWGVLSCFFSVRRAWLTLGTAGMCFGPLFAALVISSGPPRVYVPLLPFLLLLCVLGGADLARRLGCLRNTYLTLLPWYIIGALGIGWSLQQQPWLAIDWKREFAVIRQHAPANAYISYPANDSYPVMWNNRPLTFQDTARQTENMRLHGGVFIQLLRPGQICGTDRHGGEVVFPVKVPAVKLKFNRTDAEAFLLIPASGAILTPDDLIIAAIGPTVEDVAVQWRDHLLMMSQQWLIINIWMTVKMHRDNVSTPLAYFTLATKTGGITPELVAAIEKDSGNAIRFFVLRELPEK